MNPDRPLWTTALAITGIIGTWLEEHENKHLFGHFSKLDMLRLTRLQVWSWRHRVTIEDILTITIPYLRKSLSCSQQKRYKLGCSVAALTGAGNEKILINALAEQHPGAEQREEWRQREQARQLEAEAAEDRELPVKARAVKSILEYDSALDYLQSYRTAVLATRKRQARLLASSKRKRKHYRGNPWI